MSMTFTKKTNREEELASIMTRVALDVRMVSALCGDRPLNAREQNTLNRLTKERGEGIYADMLYTLTNKAFPLKQARHIWQEIINHRKAINIKLGRDIGISVAAHDYLTNATGMLQGVTIIEESKMASLANVATRDGLTSLYDQTSFKHHLKEELERQIRYGTPISLIMFDIDHFKPINDTYGHATGDRVLKELADIIRQQVRMRDIAARYGGEEFAIILPETEQESAAVFAERLRQKVEEHFKESSSPFEVTISLGVKSTHQGDQMSVEGFIIAADEQLYRAKHSGRNCVCAPK